ncbi:MAG: c-type cytochrome [Verrucomicrobia bacterium]|nr:c-type cytochrome [Verrucomicrobiota bacterium]
MGEFPDATRLRRFLLLTLALGILQAWVTRAQSAADTAAPGLAVAFTALEAQAADVAVLSNVWLYVPQGQPPTPFLPPGRFTARWTGTVNLERRAEFQFQAELAGELELEINGAPALKTSSLAPALGQPVRLNRGANTLTAVFRSPLQGDGFVRLSWSSQDTPRQPIPLSALTHPVTAAERQARQVRLGRELFLEYRCARCHTPPPAETEIAELAIDAPSFDGIGTRRRFDWLARWILDPQALQPAAIMPRLLHGPSADTDAHDIAAFLASIGPPPPATPPPASDDQVLAGKRLFDTLHCVACHNAPDSPDTDPKKISLKSVRDKFAAGALAPFLLQPDAQFAWTRMPRFTLTEIEARQLAAYLEARASAPAPGTAAADPAQIERGRHLVQTRGCLNCHELQLANQFRAPSLTSLTPGNWNQGCLAASPPGTPSAPQFTLTAEERLALAAWGATDRKSLSREVPSEFAERQSRRLRCRECHGKFDGFPAFDGLGAKLKPEWTAEYLAGQIPYNPRPWLDARMPAFPRWASALARGLAMQYGYPPRTPTEPPMAAAAAEVGRKLVSAAGGLSCVACHAIGKAPAMQAADSPGINLAYASRRLLRSYFDRWVRQPQQIDPSTKMPVFFDEADRSPLADVYGGEGAKQRNAIWQFLRLGDQMPPPPSP